MDLLTFLIGGMVHRAVVRSCTFVSSSAIVCNHGLLLAGVEQQRRVREDASSGVRLHVVSVRVLNVQPFVGPIGGSTTVLARWRLAWQLALPLRRTSRFGYNGAAARLVCTA